MKLSTFLLILSFFQLSLTGLPKDGYVSPDFIGFTSTGKFVSTRSTSQVNDMLLSAFFPEFQQTVKGTIKDANTKEPLVGANVVVEGTTNGIMTDVNGNFSINITNQNTTLLISFIGYEQQRIVVGNQTSISIELKPNTAALDEVVVVGYGTQKKESVTASVASVTSKDLSVSPAANISNMIAGRVTGLLSIQNDGTPGNDNSFIFIRGMATTGSTEPLYVIDGIPRTSSDFTRLTPTDIESISVLKDAAAAAVYGTRGANGVLLITTKRGSLQKASFSYSFNYGIQKPTRLPEYMDSYGYANLYNEALANEGRDPLYSADDLQKYKDGSDPIFHPNTDWLKVLRRPAPMQQHNLSVTGGTETIKYFLSYNYLNQKSILSDNLGFVRHNFRSNIDVQATKTTRITFDLSSYFGTTTEPGGETYWVTRNAAVTAPTIAGQYPNGLYGNGDMGLNAWAIPDHSGYREHVTDGLLSRLELNQDIPFIKGLSFKAIGAFDYKPNGQKNWLLQPKLYNAVQDGSNIVYQQVSGFGKPSLSETKGLDKNFVLEGQARYNQKFGKHNIGGLIVLSRQQISSEWIKASRSNYLSDMLDIIDVGATANQQTSGSASAYRRESVVSRFSYAYNDKYLLEFNSRYDGSDLFAKGKRFGFFPALSAGWVLTKEAFMSNIKFLNNFKIRGSYGELGNDNIGQYQYMSFYSFGSGAAIGMPPSTFQNNIYLSRLANADVTWERSKKTDFGFEALLLKNITLEFDLFWENRDNILGKRGATIPSYYGISDGQMPFENFQKIDNKGFEFTSGYNKQFSNGLSMQARFNVTSTQNKVIYIGEAADLPARMKQEGRPLNSMFGLIALGLFQSEQEIIDAYGADYMNERGIKPGDIHFQDLNGDKRIDENDRTYIGNNNVPKVMYGFNSVLSFKGFELSMFFQGASGNEAFFSSYMAQPFAAGGKALKAHTDYWRPDNTGAKYPRVTLSSNWNYGEDPNTFWKYNMSYLRLKNIEFGYSLPKQIVNKLSIDNLRVYFSGVNLLTFSKFKEVDPETGSDFGNSYPQSMVYNFGVQVAF